MKSLHQQQIITVPRGRNIGRHINSELEHQGLKGRIDIITIFTVRDLTNKVNIVTLKYQVIKLPKYLN